MRSKWLVRLLGLLLMGLLATDGRAAEEVTRGELTIDGAAAPLLATDVTMEVTAMIARVRVVQRFRNPGDAWAEGIYAFPLPHDAAVDRLRMRVGERVIEGEVREKAEAQRLYVEAKRDGKRAGLLTRERPNLFTTAVANIDPRGEVTVELEYQQSVRYTDGTFELRFPLVIGTRYIPGTPLEEAHTVTGGGWAVDTDQVPDASRITPPVVAPGEGQGRGPLNPVRIAVTLRPGLPLAELASRYHPVTIDEQGGDYRIALQEGEVPADRDFVLYWRPAPGSEPKVALFTETAGDERYALLTLAPPGRDALEANRQPREVTLVIDTSGSMHGDSLDQAKRAVAFALDRLRPQDRFNLIQFNSVTTALFPRPQPADGAPLARARNWLAGLRADGGTEMAPALEAALGGHGAEGGGLRQVVFLTDGAVGNEEALYGVIRARLGDARLFTVGIGSAPNSWLMERAARTGRGTFTHIGDVGEVAEKMTALFQRLEYPALTDIRVTVEGAHAEVYPDPLPDLYLGEPLSVALKLDAAPTAMVVEGDFAGRPWRSRVAVRPGAESPGVAVLWARRRIAALMERHAAATTSEARGALRGEVVTTALRHHLVSRFTSLVAVDKRPARPAGAPLERHTLKSNLPHGWSHEKVFGMAHTATPSWLHLLLGSLCLLLAALVWRRVV
ncbi:marine proteobacterial sortase target protein [Endothiovibrio diazotrophicus]